MKGIDADLKPVEAVMPSKSCYVSFCVEREGSLMLFWFNFR